MAITNGYLTLVEFKAYRDITSSDTTDDGVLETLIEGASRFMDNYCGQFFYSDTGTRYYRAEDGGILFVDNLQSITTLKTDDDGDRTYDDTWATTDYDLMPYNAGEHGRPYSWIEVTPEGDYSFPTEKKGVQIVGTWGYATVPDEIRMACYEIVNAADKRRSGQNLTGIAEVTAVGVVISPEDITSSARAILNGYRRGYG